MLHHNQIGQIQTTAPSFTDSIGTQKSLKIAVLGYVFGRDMFLVFYAVLFHENINLSVTKASHDTSVAVSFQVAILKSILEKPSQFSLIPNIFPIGASCITGHVRLYYIVSDTTNPTPI